MEILGINYRTKSLEQLAQFRVQRVANLANAEQDLTEAKTQLHVLQEQHAAQLKRDDEYTEYERRIEARLAELADEMPPGDISRLHGAEAGTALRLREEMLRLEREGLSAADASLHNLWARAKRLREEMQRYHETIDRLHHRIEALHREIAMIDEELRRRTPSHGEAS